MRCTTINYWSLRVRVQDPSIRYSFFAKLLVIQFLSCLTPNFLVLLSFLQKVHVQDKSKKFAIVSYNATHGNESHLNQLYIRSNLGKRRTSHREFHIITQYLKSVINFVISFENQSVLIDLKKRQHAPGIIIHKG